MTDLGMIIFVVLMLLFIGIKLNNVRLGYTSIHAQKRALRLLEVATMYQAVTAAYQRGDRAEGERLRAEADMANAAMDRGEAA